MFSVLKKCQEKLGSLIHEMLLICEGSQTETKYTCQTRFVLKYLTFYNNFNYRRTILIFYLTQREHFEIQLKIKVSEK